MCETEPWMCAPFTPVVSLFNNSKLNVIIKKLFVLCVGRVLEAATAKNKKLHIIIPPGEVQAVVISLSHYTFLICSESSRVPLQPLACF